MNRKIAFAAVAILFLGLIGSITNDAPEQAATIEQVSTPQEKTIAEEIEGVVLGDVETASIENGVLTVELFKDNYLSENSLRKIAFKDSCNVLEYAAASGKVQDVTIVYRATFYDADYNEVETIIFTGIYGPDALRVNWGNVLIEDQENVLRSRAITFVLHPALS